MSTKNDICYLNNQVSCLQQQIASVVTNQSNQDQGNTGNGPFMYMVGGWNKQSYLRSRNNCDWQSTASSMISGVRTLKKIADIHTTIQFDMSAPGQTRSNEMDSNSDTCCSGRNYVVLELTHRTANVYPYNSTSYKPLYNIRIFLVETVYYYPTIGETFILVLN